MTANSPTLIKLPQAGPPVLACGADTANRVCVTRGAEGFLGEAVGDVEQYPAFQAFLAQIERLTQYAETRPEVVAHDMHPDYVSTRHALKMDATTRVAVQHHHAHVAACLVEHMLTEQVIGVALDGTGYGPDGTVWGGEFLVADLRRFERAAHFRQYPMPGGEQAILNPSRMALGCLWSELPDDADKLAGQFLPAIRSPDRDLLLQMLPKGTRSPLTSSAGRLFDAVSALLGICPTPSHPGEPAMKLQAAARTGVTERCDFEILAPESDENGETISRRAAETRSGSKAPMALSFGPMIRRLVEEMRRKTDPAVLAAMFHNTLAEGIAEMCDRIRTGNGIDKVALAGGVFLNSLLTGLVIDKLRTRGFQVYIGDSIPRGDGGLAVGQAAVAIARTGE